MLKSTLYQNISNELFWMIRGFFHIYISCMQISTFFLIRQSAKNIQFLKESTPLDIGDSDDFFSKLWMLSKFGLFAISLFSYRASVVVINNHQDFRILMHQTLQLTQNTLHYSLVLVLQIIIQLFCQRLITQFLNFLESNVNEA